MISDSQHPTSETAAGGSPERRLPEGRAPRKRSELPAAALYVAIFALLIIVIAYFVFAPRANQRRIAGLYLAKARALLRHDEFDDAAKMLDKAKSEDPGNTQAQTEQLKAALFKLTKQSDPPNRILDLEKLDKAEADCKRLLSNEPRSAELTALLGIIYAYKDQPALAFETYKQAQELDPKYPNVRNYWGYTAVQWHFPDNWRELAAEQFNQARELDPTYASPRINLALLSVHQAQLEASIQLLAETEKLERNSEGLYGLWGVALVLWGEQLLATDKVGAYEKFAQALDKYRIAETLNPDIALIHYNQGNALGYLERDAAAIDEYKRAIELEPGFAYAHANLAELLVKRKDSGRRDLEEAIAHLNEAIRVTQQTIDQYKYRKTKTPDAHAQRILEQWMKQREGEKAYLENQAREVIKESGGTDQGSRAGRL